MYTPRTRRPCAASRPRLLRLRAIPLGFTLALAPAAPADVGEGLTPVSQTRCVEATAAATNSQCCEEQEECCSTSDECMRCAKDFEPYDGTCVAAAGSARGTATIASQFLTDAIIGQGTGHGEGFAGGGGEGSQTGTANSRCRVTFDVARPATATFRAEIIVSIAQASNSRASVKLLDEQNNEITGIALDDTGADTIDIVLSLAAGRYTLDAECDVFSQGEADASFDVELRVTLCRGDVNGDGNVDLDDVLAVLAAWGDEGGPADVDGDGVVGLADLLVVLANWGPCVESGACCLDDEGCLGDLTASVCALRGGLYRGDGSTCEAPCRCRPDESARLIASRGGSPHFGAALDIDGSTLIAGAPADDFAAHNGGRAAIFRSVDGAWALEQFIQANDPAEGDWFGSAVSVLGSTALAGAPFNNITGTNDGAAYFFAYSEAGGWQLRARVLSPMPAVREEFGGSVALFESQAFIGAPGSGTPGSVYLFRDTGDTWTAQQTLSAPDGGAFGTAIAVSGNALVVGAPEVSGDSGAAYVYRRTEAWDLEQTLTVPDGGALGSAAAIDGNVIVLGAPLDDDPGPGAGAAYVFRDTGSGWQLEQTLRPSDRQVDIEFGTSVAVRGDMIVVGTSAREPSGWAYVFRFDGVSWNEDARMTGGDRRDDLGATAAFGDGFVGVGAPRADSDGAVVIYSGIGDCNENGFLDACDIAHGRSADANGNGIPDECE